MGGFGVLRLSLSEKWLDYQLINKQKNKNVIKKDKKMEKIITKIKSRVSNLSATLVNNITLRKNFIQFVKNDMTYYKNRNIAVYYELLSRDNCELQGHEYGETFNAIDGSNLYQEQKKTRKKVGYVYSKSTPVIIGGIQMKRIIITLPENGNSGDFFGLASGYLQAENQIVCYMKYIKQL